MGRESKNKPQDQRLNTDADAARQDPDAVPGLVVDKRPEKAWLVRPVFFWLMVAFFVVLAVMYGFMAWTIGRVFERMATPGSLGTMQQSMVASMRLMYIVLAISPISGLAGVVYQRRAARRDLNRRKTAFVVLVAAMIHVAALWFAVPWQLSGISGIEYLPALFIAAIAAFVMVFSINPNAPVYLHCRKCNYEFVPGPQAPRICPECGRNWLKRRGLVRRRHEKKFTMPKVAAMFMFVVAWFAMVAAPEIHALVPTDWVITLASKPLANLDASDWNRLKPSELSDAQVQRLASGLLSKREAHGEFDFSMSDTWFEDAFEGGRILPTLVDQYHHNWFTLSLIVPDRVVSSRSFEVGLRASETSLWLSGSRDIFLVFGGFRFGDGSLQSRGGKVVHPWAMLDEIDPEQAFRPTASLVSESPGRYQVAAEYWVIAWPTGANRPGSVDWNEDGSLERPDEAIYFKRFEISETFEVLPR